MAKSVVKSRAKAGAAKTEKKRPAKAERVYFAGDKEREELIKGMLKAGEEIRRDKDGLKDYLLSLGCFNKDLTLKKRLR